MPPSGLTIPQYLLWQQDANLRASFPGVDNGNPMHISGQFSFGQKWAEWEKSCPEVIARANELAKGFVPPDAPVTQTIIQIVKENPLSLDALEEIANLYANLSCTMYKYIKAHSEPDGNPPDNNGVVEGGPQPTEDIHRGSDGQPVPPGDGEEPD
jgi:hypothetical protein